MAELEGRIKREELRSNNRARGMRDIEHVANEGMERFGESDIEGKAAVGSGE